MSLCLMILFCNLTASRIVQMISLPMARCVIPPVFVHKWSTCCRSAIKRATITLYVSRKNVFISGKKALYFDRKSHLTGFFFIYTFGNKYNRFLVKAPVYMRCMLCTVKQQWPSFTDVTQRLKGNGGTAYVCSFEIMV